MNEQAARVVSWLRRSDGRIEDIFGLWVQGKRDDWWVAEKLIEEGHIAALAASSEGPTAPALDMEPLREIVARYVALHRPDGECNGKCSAWAALVAAGLTPAPTTEDVDR